MDIRETGTHALQSILRSKLRSSLTMLGIIIGIGSVIMLSSVGAGQEYMLNKAFAGMGLNSYQISPDFNNPNLRISSNDMFTINDEKLISQNPNVQGVSITQQIDPGAISIMSNSGPMSYQTNNNFQMTSVDPSYFQMNNIQFLYGRAFQNNPNDENSIVIDNLLSEKLFGTDNSIGQQITVNIQDQQEGYQGVYTFTIDGVFSNPTILLNKVNNSSSNQMTGGMSTYFIYFQPKKFMQITGHNRIAFLVVQLKPNVNTKQVLQQLKNSIATFHQTTPDTYKIINSNQFTGGASAQMQKMNMFVSFIAAISLLVGGIGVMNIMLVAVTERTKEIGIRKSIGATNEQILVQFLIEAVILTILGGIIGIIVGYIGSLIQGIFTQITPILDIKMVIISVVVSIVIGIVFGVFPAKKASKLNPIEALRYE
ncbi:MAG: ABC transporter permease [Fusobacteria bacterium]|nr:ABC transporter permease [Fusobacteriota bacterium]